MATIEYLPNGDNIVNGVLEKFKPKGFSFFEESDKDPVWHNADETWRNWAKARNRITRKLYEDDCKRRGTKPIK